MLAILDTNQSELKWQFNLIVLQLILSIRGNSLVWRVIKINRTPRKGGKCD